MDSEVPLGDQGTHQDPPALQFFVPGVPISQGSKRHVGRGIMVESSKNLAPWRQAIAAEAMNSSGGLKLYGPLILWACFWFTRPAGHFGAGRNKGKLKKSAPHWKDGQPDLDKLLRAVGDGLVASGVIPDDRHIVKVMAEKRWGDPGVLIRLESATAQGGG